MQGTPVLLPQPRTITMGAGSCAHAERIVESIDPAEIPHAQGYRLVITPADVRIIANDPAGAFYARKTLAQLRRLHPRDLPCLQIDDWPDFPHRGVMLDISRDKVPTMQTLYVLVDMFAELKLNQLQLYTEHTFAYSQHREVWHDASPMTADEIRALDEYCRARFIELVPNQNSFGHMERWLKHERYKPLAEKPEGFMFPWNFWHEGGFSLNPLDPASLELIEGLYDELLPNFTSAQFNVGCDETFDVGLGKSKAECQRRGKERVYLDFLLKIHDAVSRRGKRMQFWGDIILHKPELIRELPRDVIALNWGYDRNHPFETETRAFADAGLDYYVCPGTSSWSSISGQTDNAVVNLCSAAEHGLANGAIGYLNTDWGDWGHLQYLPVSFPGISLGAGVSWCVRTNRDLPLTEALDAHVFQDESRVMGRLMYDFGNVYQAVKTPMSISTRLFWTFVGGKPQANLFGMISDEEFDDAEQRVDAATRPLSGARMQRPDADLIVREIRNAAAMLTHACARGRWLKSRAPSQTGRLREHLLAIIETHRALWRARNRTGGERDSVGRLEVPLADYAPAG